VRTRNVGHVRDVRRLVVAMSRARLGLYIVARVSLFQNCFELSPAFSQLMSRPLQLYLAPNETWPTTRRADDAPSTNPLIIQDMPHIAQFVYDFYKEKIAQLAARQQSHLVGVGKPALLPLPGSVGGEVVRQQARHDQGREEEHPGVDSDEEEKQE